MPHTWIVWEHNQSLCHIAIQGIGVVRRPLVIENCYILLVGLENTSNMSAVFGTYAPFSTTNVNNFLETNNTRWDIVSKKIQLSISKIEDIKNFNNVIN